MAAVFSRQVFPLIKADKLWAGTMSFSKDILFVAPKNADLSDKPKTAIRIVDGITYLRSPSVWFTNLDHGRRHQPLPLMTMKENLKYSKHKEIKGKKSYEKYDNYSAIEVSFTDAIPSDYDGVMGVPISFLDKYNPDQFEITGMAEDNGKGFSGGIWDGKNPHCVINGQNKFKRIFIKRKKVKK